LPDVVHRLKTLTTKRYVDGVKQNGWRPFPGKLWQRNYWEHVVRNASELTRVCEYIQNNPNQWESDKLHPHQLMRDGWGTARRVRAGIREPSAIYEYNASSNDEGWMV
jgi:hypothetical protein